VGGQHDIIMRLRRVKGGGEAGDIKNFIFNKRNLVDIV